QERIEAEPFRSCDPCGINPESESVFAFEKSTGRSGAGQCGAGSHGRSEKNYAGASRAGKDCENYSASQTSAFYSGELCNGRGATRFESVVDAGPDRQRRAFDLHDTRSGSSKRCAAGAGDAAHKDRASIQFSSSAESELSAARERGRGFVDAVSGRGSGRDR